MGCAAVSVCVCCTPYLPLLGQPAAGGACVTINADSLRYYCELPLTEHSVGVLADWPQLTASTSLESLESRL